MRHGQTGRTYSCLFRRLQLVGYTTGTILDTTFTRDPNSTTVNTAYVRYTFVTYQVTRTLAGLSTVHVLCVARRRRHSIPKQVGLGPDKHDK
jgi:hypothetical protein